MDDDKIDKNLFEKTIEAVKEIAHTASEAAKHAMEPEPLKSGEKVVVMPMVTNGMMGENMMPSFVVVRRGKKTPKKTAKKTKKAVKKTAKKSGKKKAAKKRKSRAAVANKKTGKKAVTKKKAKKPRR
jgi:hypothetical protein